MACAALKEEHQGRNETETQTRRACTAPHIVYGFLYWRNQLEQVQHYGQQCAWPTTQYSANFLKRPDMKYSREYNLR